MKLGTTAALAAMLSLPIAAYYGRQKLDERTLPPQVYFEQPLEEMSPVPFIRKIAPIEEIGRFFEVKRDPEKGFIYLQSHESTKGIINHLVNSHGMDPETAIKVINTVDRVTQEFNKEVQSLKQVEINISDLSKALNPTPEIDALINKQPVGAFGVQNKPATQAVPVIIPGLRDYVDSVREHVELTLNDGFANPISVLPRAMDLMTEHGFPYLLHLEEGISVVPGSEKLVFYLDKRDGIVKTAPYLELSEPAGDLGPGGTSSLIFSGPTVIFTKDKVYFIGFDQNRGIQAEKFDPAKQIPNRNPLDLLIPGNNLLLVRNNVF